MPSLFLAQPGLEIDNQTFILVCKLKAENGKVTFNIADNLQYYFGATRGLASTSYWVVTRQSGAVDDTNPNWPFLQGALLEPWQREIRNKYRAADRENWPKG